MFCRLRRLTGPLRRATLIRVTDPSAPSAPAEDPFAPLDASARARAEAGLTRRVRVRRSGDAVLDLAGNDYLGLARHPAVVEAAAEAAREWGAGATGSRLVSGSTALHAALERELAEHCGAPAALVFSSGYTANLAMVTALADPQGELLCDRHNHASLIDAARLAKAGGTAVKVLPHGDTAAVRAALERPGAGGRRLVLSDTVFSVDGDLADVARLHAACTAHGSGLLLDDAHGLGVLGPGGAGAVSAAGLRGEAAIVVSVTLSKALGSQGGAVLGSRRVIRHLTETARTFIFDTALAPPAAAGALAALRLLRAEPDRAARVRGVARRLAEGLREAGFTVAPPRGAVVAATAPSPSAALAWAGECRARGVAVGCFRPPSVPDEHSRLRLTARADLGDSEVERALRTVIEAFPGGRDLTAAGAGPHAY